MTREEFAALKPGDVIIISPGYPPDKVISVNLKQMSLQVDSDGNSCIVGYHEALKKVEG